MVYKKSLNICEFQEIYASWLYLVNLVRHCMDNQGVVSKNRRKQYVYKVPAELFEALEQEYRLFESTKVLP